MVAVEIPKDAREVRDVDEEWWARLREFSEGFLERGNPGVPPLTLADVTRDAISEDR